MATDPWKARVDDLHAKLMAYLAAQQGSGLTNAEIAINWLVQRIATLQLTVEKIEAHLARPPQEPPPGRRHRR